MVKSRIGKRIVGTSFSVLFLLNKRLISLGQILIKRLIKSRKGPIYQRFEAGENSGKPWEPHLKKIQPEQKPEGKPEKNARILLLLSLLLSSTMEEQSFIFTPVFTLTFFDEKPEKGGIREKHCFR